MRSFALLLIILVIFVASLITSAADATSSAARRKEKPAPHHYAPDVKIHNEMPDHTDPQNKKRLQCSSCKVLTQEFWERLHALSERNNGRPRRDQQMDVLESMCNEVKIDYGLVMRNNKPTLEFSREDAISRLKGSWVNVYLETRCGNLVSNHDEVILDKHKTLKNLAEFQQFICQTLDKSCLNEKFVNADL